MFLDKFYEKSENLNVIALSVYVITILPEGGFEKPPPPVWIGLRDEPLENLWGGGGAGEVQTKYSRKGKVNEKKFMYAN